jgi:P-type E1-E2 ATPase
MLDMQKVYNAGSLSRDTKMPGAFCRNSSIPEELGSLEFLFSDKTGTLTKNEMQLKKLAVDSNLQLSIETKETEFDQNFNLLLEAISVCHNVKIQSPLP